VNLEISNNEKYLLLMSLAKLDYETFHAFKSEKPAERHLLINRVALLGEQVAPSAGCVPKEAGA